MENGITSILKEISETEIEYVDLSLRKYKHSEVSKIEPHMSDSDFSSLVEDIKLTGSIHTPVLIYNHEILDGRNRQRAAIELGNLPLPVKVLKGDYGVSQLGEFVRSIHMNRSKSKTQKEIQAFKYKQTIANISWEEASSRYGVAMSSVKKINTLYNILSKQGLETDFSKVVESLEYGMSLTTNKFSWLEKRTSSFSGAIKQLNLYIEAQEINDLNNNIDLTEVDPESGEFLEKQENIFLNRTLSHAEIVKKLEEAVVAIGLLTEQNKELTLKLEEFTKESK